MVAWKDITTYTQNDKVRTPRVYVINLGKIRLTVHRHIDWPEDQWLASCQLFPMTQLSFKEIDKAKWEAVNIFESALVKALKDIELLRGESNDN